MSICPAASNAHVLLFVSPLVVNIWKSAIQARITPIPQIHHKITWVVVMFLLFFGLSFININILLQIFDIIVIIIIILGLVALNNFGNLFKTPNPEENMEEADEENEALPTFDPYLALQQNQTNQEDFYQQEIQFTSAVDKKKSEIINNILGNPEEAARILTSYIKE